jgi:hypothetical protein
MPMYRSPGGRDFLGARQIFVRWAFFPYGTCLTSEGRQILFNRFYEPIWQRQAPDGAVEPADPKEQVKDITDQRWIYDDDPNEKSKRALGYEVLRSWGLPEPTSAQAIALRGPFGRPRLTAAS